MSVPILRAIVVVAVVAASLIACRYSHSRETRDTPAPGPVTFTRDVEGVATLPDGTERWLIRINDWDFKWQDVYCYAKLIPLPKKTTIRMRYTYDNSAGNPRNPNRPPRRVVAGLRSSDEMAHLQLQVQTQRAEDLLLLKEALYRHTLGKNPRDVWIHYEALRLEPEFAEVHNNLGEVLASRQRLVEALVHFREAVRLKPDSAEAHDNLGAGLGLQGKFDEAVSHFRRGLEIQPDHAGAHENLRLALAEAGSAGRVKR